MTHAFFKACLFLGSGSVIHTMEHAEHAAGGHRHYTEMQDMRNMGGLKQFMPRTFLTFIIATAALAGAPFLAGFFSKDEILWETFHEGHYFLWAIAVAAAGMTAFYMTRQVCLTFYGEFRGGEAMKGHLHESPSSMTLPLLVLAFGSVFAGYVGLPFGYTWIGPFLEPAIQAGIPFEPVEAPHEYAKEIFAMVCSVGLALAGFLLARSMYLGKPEGDKAVTDRFPAAHRVLYNKYYVDEIYDATVVGGTVSGAHGLSAFDQEVIDGAVNGAAKLTVLSGEVSNLTDMGLVDRIVNLVGERLSFGSRLFRRFQTGVLQNYALFMLFGVCVMVGVYYFWGQ